MLKYCKKCGRLIQDSDECDICHSIMYEVPEKYWLAGLNFAISDKMEQQLYEELVKPSPEFDEELFNARPQIMEKKEKKYKQYEAICDDLANGYDMRTALKHVKDAEEGRSIPSQQPNTPHCPTCGSTNIQKISGTKRWLTTGLFGLASSDVGKTMVCKKCGYKF